MPESRGRKKSASRRYQLEPDRKKPTRASPVWFAPLMVVIMLVGVAVIVWNYTRADSASNSTLFVGLGLIGAGFFGITFWK
ncbi:MAG TPA: cell division protein CrgA [Actinomycetota bacterium]|nr:cell division protein CrgA [Actinomycetota bacterium]